MSSSGSPNTFDGAIALGHIDQPSTNTGLPDPRFLCGRGRLRLEFGGFWNVIYYSFVVESIPTRLIFIMDEEPSTTLWLELLNSQHNVIGTSAGNANEKFDQVFSPGLYFIRVNTASGVPTIGGYNYANISVYCLPEKVDLSKNLGHIRHLGSISRDAKFEIDGALWSIDQRSPVDYGDVSFIIHDCPPRNNPILYSYDEFTLDVTEDGIINFDLDLLADRFWYRERLNVYIFLNGEYRVIPDKKIHAIKGRLQFALGYWQNIQYIPPDRYAEYRCLIHYGQ